MSARYPRRKRGLVPVRWYHGHVPARRAGADDPGRERPPAADGPARPRHPLPARPGPVGDPRLRRGPPVPRRDRRGPRRAPTPRAGPGPGPGGRVDLGIIHPYAVAGPEGQGCWCPGGPSAPSTASTCATARAAAGPPPPAPPSRDSAGHGGGASTAGASGTPRPGTSGGCAGPARSRQQVITWAVQTDRHPRVGDPRGVLQLKAGRRHNQRTRDWRVGHLIRVLADKAEAAGITVHLVDERGTSSTCPACARRVPKPAGRIFSCPHCGQQGHRDLVAAASIAARAPGGGTIPAIPHGAGITHRRAGGTSPVSTRHDVTPAAGPHHGRHPGGTWPAPARPAPRHPRRRHTGSRSRQREEPARHQGQPPTNFRTRARVR